MVRRGCLLLKEAVIMRGILDHCRSRFRTLNGLINNLPIARGYATHLQVSDDKRRHLVILGSGWAGHLLSRSLDHTLFRVTVVSPRDHFVFTPFLAATAAGQLEHRCVIEPIRSRRMPIEFHQAWCDSFDFQNKTIECTPAFEGGTRTRGRPNANPHALTSLSETLENKRSKRTEYDVRGQPVTDAEKFKFTLKYDDLVISIGSYNQTFGIPGVREHAFFLKEVNEARSIRRKLLENFEMAALPSCPPQARKALLNVTCVGAGPTGVEVMAELHDLVRSDLSRVYDPELIKLSSFTLFDVADDILTPFDRKLRQYAKDHFTKSGVHIRTGTTIEKIDAWQLTIKGQEKKEPYGLIIWSTGLKQNPSIQNLVNVEKDPKRGRLQTDGFFRVFTSQGAVYPDVYAIGDCASPRGQDLPQTAQCASQEAKHLSKILHAKIRGQTSPRPFQFSNLGALAYIGGHEALVDLSKESKDGERTGFRSEGKLALRLYRSVYWVKTLSWRNAIMVPVHWFVVFLFGRDISKL